MKKITMFACVCDCVICKTASSRYRNRLKHTIFNSCEITCTMMFPMMRVIPQNLYIKFTIFTQYTFMRLGFLLFYIIINAYTQKEVYRETTIYYLVSVYTTLYYSHFWTKNQCETLMYQKQIHIYIYLLTYSSSERPKTEIIRSHCVTESDDNLSLRHCRVINLIP